MTIYGPPVRGRSCGSCKLCCTLLPVDLPNGKKPSNVKCGFLCSKGCSIYKNRPVPCQYWSCRWLFDEDTSGLKRPDRSGYIIDSALDTVIADGKPVEVIQVWVDPDRRDSHRDPELRSYILEMAVRHGLLTIIRWSSKEAMVLVAPIFSTDNEWIEHTSDMKTEDEMANLLGSNESAWRRQVLNGR